MILIDILVVIVVVHQIAYWNYYWQLKEYRRDRFWDGLRDNWGKIFGEQYDLRRWYRPKLTVRVVINLILSLGGLFLGWRGLILVPLWVAVVVGVLTPVFNWQKKRIIDEAREKMRSFKGLVIGVTGSYGKSSTKEMLGWLLAEKYRVAQTSENVNSEIGVAKTVLGLKGDEDFLIVEMGAYKVGEIRAICEMVLPRVGIITGIGDQHLSLFGSLENIKKAKYELIDSLPGDGYGLVAGRDFSTNEAKEIKQDKDKVSFKYKNVLFEVPILGTELVRNVIGVIKMGEYLKLDLKEIARRLKDLPGEKLWPRLIRVGKKLVMVDDSYNASLESFLSVLEYAKVWVGYKKVLVTPGMIELGARADEDHEMVGRSLEIIDKVFLTSRRWNLKLKGGKVEVESNFENLVKKIKKEIEGESLVIFKGRIPRVVIDSLAND